MLKRLFTMMKASIGFTIAASIVFIIALSTLSGCDNDKEVKDLYPLESVLKEGKQESYVYRAANESVPDIAKKLADQKKPEQMSKEDENQMFLVYPDEWYNIQKDKEKPSDTLIEVSNKEFVRQNYQPSFLEGFIVGSIVSNLFDSHKPYYGDYRGYTSRKTYKPIIDYRPPTVQEKKTLPPLTKQGTGSIIKRSDKVNNSGTSVGSEDGVTKKGNQTVPPSEQNKGKIIKSPDKPSGSDVKPKSSITTPPKNTSPPKTRVGGSGKITKRR
ncbi:DUF4247 domain-containing protein [Bacillus sp. CGMCC 1.60114]|uniref:DUF4247 domain-containing protein n=1 Tax=unclassified Bacillus (in: firmicutes) TaxID=185979 RepID=UPI0036443D37